MTDSIGDGDDENELGMVFNWDAFEEIRQMDERESWIERTLRCMSPDVGAGLVWGPSLARFISEA